MQSQILIVEDQAMVQDVLCSFLRQREDFHPTGCKTKSEALALIAENGAYDLTLVDLKLPDASTVQDHAEIVSASDGNPVALLSANARREDVSIALKMGMKGYLSKRMPANELLEAVQTLLDGESYLPKTDENTFAMRETDILMDSLSNLEKEILGLMKLGLSNAEISGELKIRTNHIAKSVTDIYRKIGVRTRLQAVTLVHI
ncbi:response regulator [Pseudosulfitobacter sp. SM2401]|uniref:response regulator n=1 Tax=Pseudosulfitobacter sp. SM2401 TaxID=3350098 RepID=UPI0036F1A32E